MAETSPCSSNTRSVCYYHPLQQGERPEAASRCVAAAGSSAPATERARNGRRRVGSGESRPFGDVSLSDRVLDWSVPPVAWEQSFAFRVYPFLFATLEVSTPQAPCP